MANDLVNVSPNVEVSPSGITIKNQDVLEGAVANIVAKYGQDFVVTKVNLSDTKNMRSELNKVVKLFDDSRKAAKKQYMVPLKNFESIMNGFRDQVVEVVDPLKEKIDEVETDEREERLAIVQNEINEMAPNYGVSPSDIELRPSWLNKSAMKSSGTALTKSTLDEIASDMTQLKKDRDQRATDIETIKTYADQMGIEPAGWAALLNQGVSLTDIFKQINQATAQRDQEAKEKADREAKQKEAKAAIDATHQKPHDGEIIDTDTGEIVPQTIILRLTGPRKKLAQVWTGAKKLGVECELLKKKSD